MSEKLIAYKDDRERCEYNVPNCEIIVARSEIADFIIPQLDLCVENKSMLDLFMSITDKRIYSQAEKMQKYKWKYLYLKTGDYNQLDEIKQKAIETITLKLLFLYGIVTIRVKGQTMLNYSLNRLVEFILKKDEISQEHFIKTFGGFETDYDRVVMAISCAKGYGIKLSKRVVDIYKSIEVIVNTNESNFTTIVGVGDVKAKELFDFLHKKVENTEQELSTSEDETNTQNENK